MAKNNTISEPVFSVCPECNGSGEMKLGMPCGHCKGAGLGAAADGRIFYWGKKLSLLTIRIIRLRRSVYVFLNIFAYLAGVSGVLALGFWAFQNYSSGHASARDFFIWQKKNIFLLWFWLSVFFDMFAVYRLSEESRKYGERKIERDDPLPGGPGKEKRKLFSLTKKFKEQSSVKIEVSKYFSLPAEKIIEDAHLLARTLGHETVGVRHLFLSLLNDEKTLAMLIRLDANLAVLRAKIESRLSELEKNPAVFSFRASEDNDFKKAMIAAYLSAREIGQTAVEPMNFILPIITRDRYIEDLFYEMEIDRTKIANAVSWLKVNEEMIRRYRRFRSQSRFKPATNMNRAYTAVATPLLDNFGYDLTIAAKWGKLDYCVEREKETAEIFSAVDSGQLGVILVGPAGAGKKTMIQGIAELMAEENVPKIFRDKRLIEIDASRLVAGATAAQAEERLNELITEANLSGNIILAMRDIENITGISAGGEQSLELSEVLANAIDRKFVICIATATPENYAKYLEGKSLGSAMVKVEVNEPQGDRAIRIISSKIGHLEGRYGVFFSYAALEQAIAVTGKYMHDSYLPAKAIKVLELAAGRAGKREEKDRRVTKQDIFSVVSELTHIPVAEASGDESRKLLRLEEEIHKYMVDQVEAVNMVSASLRRARAQMTEGKRPIASFLFLGPTGVGKTELAKSISRVYFGDEKCMIRLDMSEYQHPDSIKNLIGAEGAPGYLTEAVHKAPFSLILLDEFEKADKNILNLFLQVMDDGRLTDGAGRTVDFTNSIIIATSNAGALFIQDALKDGGAADYEAIKETLINEHLNKVMRPELINRFDGLIVFKPLSEQDVIDITRLMVNNLGKRLLEKGISLEASEAGIGILAHEGFDPKFGARPLRRLLQDKIENIIANKILAGELKRRDMIIINDQAGLEVVKGRKL
ncbi:MAG: ATP-dependent Clp protease ATP-binding subunit [Patescibacteria group bacterium]|jgi:ATP-dependent Clp protease ATP-binding subunit ClpC